MSEVDALIVFDGDNRRGRVAEAKKIYDTAKPARVWLLGDRWMWDALWRSGIPYDLITPDKGPPNTRAQMDWVQRFESTRPGRTAIVASRIQMPRIAALAEAAGIRAVLAPSPADTEPARSGVRQFVPTYYALRISRDALYEHVALVYYRYNGWIR